MKYDSAASNIFEPLPSIFLINVSTGFTNHYSSKYSWKLFFSRSIPFDRDTVYKFPNILLQNDKRHGESLVDFVCYI